MQHTIMLLSITVALECHQHIGLCRDSRIFHTQPITLTFHLIGSFLVGPVLRLLGRRWLIGLNILGNGLMFAAPLLTANPWLMGISILIGGISGPMWGVAATSFQQRVVPEALRGRVFAAYRFISWGAEALGPAIGGIVAQYTGIQMIFLGSALLTALMFVPFFRIVTEQTLRANNAPVRGENDIAQSSSPDLDS